MEREIAAFLQEAKPSLKGGIEAILASQDLFEDGWLDSLLNLRLLAFLEQASGKRIPALQVTRKNFRTVAAIAALVK